MHIIVIMILILNDYTIMVKKIIVLIQYVLACVFAGIKMIPKGKVAFSYLITFSYKNTKKKIYIVKHKNKIHISFISLCSLKVKILIKPNKKRTHPDKNNAKSILSL